MSSQPTKALAQSPLRPASTACRYLRAVVLAFIFIVALTQSASALQVIISYTNSSTGALDTNDFKTVPLNNIQNADGSYNTIGLPVRWHNPTGITTNWLVANNYLLTNTASGFWTVMKVYDSSSNVVSLGAISLPNANPFFILVIPTNQVPAGTLTNANAFDTNGAAAAVQAGVQSGSVVAAQASHATNADTATTAANLTGAGNIVTHNVAEFLGSTNSGLVTSTNLFVKQTTNANGTSYEVDNTNSTSSGGVTNAAVFNLPTNFASIFYPTNFMLANPCAPNQIIVKSVNGTWTTNSTTTNTDVGRGYLLSTVMDNASGGAGDVFYLPAGRFVDVNYSFQNANGMIDLTEGGLTHAGAHLVGAGKNATVVDFLNTGNVAFMGDFSCIRDVTFTNCQGFGDSGDGVGHATNNVYDVFYNFGFYQTTNFQDVFLLSANYANFWFENCTFVFPYDVFASSIVPDTNSILVSHNSTYIGNALGRYPIVRTQYGVMARTCYVSGDTVSATGATSYNIGIDGGDSGLTNSTMYVWNTAVTVSGSNVLQSVTLGAFPSSAIFIGSGCSIDVTKINNFSTSMTGGSLITVVTQLNPPNKDTNSVVNTIINGKLIGNGGGLTNIPSTAVAFTVINTNFLPAFIYSNIYGAPIQVSANAALTTASVAGMAQISLRAIGATTNYSSELTAIGLATGTFTNPITPIIVPVNGTYTFTNTSSGTGNSAIPVNGQIFIY